MLKIMLTAFVLSLLLLFAPTDAQSGTKNPANTEDGSGTLQKMIVASGNGTSSQTEELKSTSSDMLSALRFAVARALKGEAGLEAPTLVHGPDVIVGDLPDMAQFGSAGTQVGLGMATDACNNGDQPINWFALPNTDHPVVPQNLYRMSGGADNTTRFEQIGQSWMKHTFGADESNACGFGCNTNACSQGVQLCPGCSDLYFASTNADQNSIGSRAWVNPFTGSFPSNANDHSGHIHNGVSHRILVEVDDLNQNLNEGATYFAEAQYVTPHEYAWCQAHPGQCNMFNNASYRQFLVSGTTNFTFSPVGNTVRMQAAINAWTGATISQIGPFVSETGDIIDGIILVGYKVTNPSPGVYHYEYAIYNQNLDHAIQSFGMGVRSDVNITNAQFHAPPQHPGWAHDGTVGDAGYSSTPWTFTRDSVSANWSTETFDQNPNANAIRWGTLYNFSFDADAAPILNSATLDFFKPGLGSGTIAQVASPPYPEGPTPTPTPTATATATATATVSPRPTPTPRPSPAPRSRPTPAHRPAPPP